MSLKISFEKLLLTGLLAGIIVGMLHFAAQWNCQKLMIKNQGKKFECYYGWPTPYQKKVFLPRASAEANGLYLYKGWKDWYYSRALLFDLIFWFGVSLVVCIVGWELFKSSKKEFLTMIIFSFLLTTISFPLGQVFPQLIPTGKNWHHHFGWPVTYFYGGFKDASSRSWFRLDFFFFDFLFYLLILIIGRLLLRIFRKNHD